LRRPRFFGNLVEAVQKTSPQASPALLTWDEICKHPEYRGRWLALSNCRYDDAGETQSAAVVDADECLSTLCQRVRLSELRDCAIVRCDAKQGR
jgi:hypothetical protein